MFRSPPSLDLLKQRPQSSVDSQRICALRSWLAIIVLILFASLFPCTLLAQEKNPASAKTIRNVQDVIANWSPSQHLYVKGNIGAGKPQLDALEAWLRQNGKNWTIVLMENAQGENFKTTSESYTGIDAVEVGLGFGLSNQTTFGLLEDTETGETNGAIFALFLNERKFSYFGSDAQDRRDLGEAHWNGELDQPAIRAMRSGRRIIDAVKDTVTSINGRLTNAIAQEAEAKRNAEQERLRSIASLNALLERIEKAILEVAENGKAIKGKYPNAQGPLVKPPLDQWTNQVGEIRSSITPERSRDLLMQGNRVLEEVNLYLNAASVREGWPTQVANFEGHRAVIASALNNVAKDHLIRIDDILRAGQTSYENGDLTLSDTIKNLETEVTLADSAIKSELDRQKQEELINTVVWRTFLAIVSGISFVFILVLVVLNRLRKKSMQKAIEALENRRKTLVEDSDKIDRLFTRNEEILGSKKKIDERGYEGKTKELSYRALQYVDELFIISKEVRRILKEAQTLVYPQSITSQLLNYFSSSRYEQAQNLLSGKKLEFNRETGLPLILRDYLQSKSPGSAAKNDQAAESVKISFEEALEVFKSRGTEAETALKTIENSLEHIHDEIVELQKKTANAQTLEKSLNAQAEKDGYFVLNNFFQSLIPSVVNDIQRADDLSAFDAVQAMQDVIPVAHRKLSEVTQLADTLQRARKESFPKLESYASILKQANLSIDWIDQDLDQLSARANELVKQAIDRSIAEDNVAFSVALESIVTRASGSVEILSQLDKKAIVELKALEDRIEASRSAIAKRFGIDGNKALREIEQDPTHHATRAQRAFDGARTVLNQGKVDAAKSSMDSGYQEISIATHILDATEIALKTFEERAAKTGKQIIDSTARIEAIRDRLVDAKKLYSAPALLLSYSKSSSKPNDEPEGNANQDSKHEALVNIGGVSCEQVLSDVSNRLAKTSSTLATTEELFASGRVLESVGQLEKVIQAIAEVDLAIARVNSHLQLLDNQTLLNDKTQADCELRLQDLLSSNDDPLVTLPTLEQIRRMSERVATSAKRVLDRTNASNPFEIAKLLSAQSNDIEQLKSAIAADHKGHEEASRAVTGAIRQWEIGNQLIRQSQTDNIPDSQLTTQLVSKIRSMKPSVESLQRAIQEAHGNWESIDESAARLQAELSGVSQSLGKELQNASEALSLFETASKTVYQAANWSGPWGLSIPGAPGSRELERAREGLQRGNYGAVLEVSRMAAMAAQAAIRQVEREVERRRLEQERIEEAARRAREAAMRATISTRSFGNDFTFGSSSSGSIFSSGGWSGGSSSSSSSSTSSNDSGFGRSGW